MLFILSDDVTARPDTHLLRKIERSFLKNKFILIRQLLGAAAPRRPQWQQGRRLPGIHKDRKDTNSTAGLTIKSQQTFALMLHA